VTPSDFNPAPVVDWNERVKLLRIAFVDDEKPNCRLGLRLLARIGIPATSVTVLTDGAWCCDPCWCQMLEEVVPSWQALQR
jgi:hypothetical protein